MDFGAIAFAIIQFIFGIWQEAETTKEQCAELESAGVAVYPLTQEQFERLDKCKNTQESKDAIP